MFKLVIIKRTEDCVICKTLNREEEKIFFLNKVYLPPDLQIGDKIYHIEHGFCDVYRNGAAIYGLGFNYKKALVRIE